MHRKLAVTAVLALVFAGACEVDPPPPPPLTMTVDVSSDASDTDPGDGTCATAGGGCSLRAAIEEAAHHPDVLIEVRVGTGVTGALPPLANRVRIVGTTSPAPQIVLDVPLEVATGATVGMSGLQIWGSIGVDGSLNAEQLTVTYPLSDPWGVAPLHIKPGGVVAARNSVFMGAHQPQYRSVDNEGVAVFDATQVGGLIYSRWTIPSGPLHTAPGASATVRSTYLASGCTGSAPSSLGYSADAGGTCSLSGLGDVSNALQGGSTVGPPLTGVDAIPAGVADCGTFITTDVSGAVRPADGDGDGTAACDIGALELPAP